MERSFHKRQAWPAFKEIMEEYFLLNHAESVPPHEMNKSEAEVFYCLCMQCTSSPAQPLKCEFFLMPPQSPSLVNRLMIYC